MIADKVDGVLTKHASYTVGEGIASQRNERFEIVVRLPLLSNRTYLSEDDLLA